jgi:urease gamma subunit
LSGTLNGDAIIASAEALAIVRAGRLVSALVIAGLETLKRTVVMAGGRKLALEFGIYRIVR